MSHRLSRIIVIGILVFLMAVFVILIVHWLHLRQLGIEEDAAGQITEPTIIYTGGPRTITLPFRVEQGEIVLAATSEGRPVQCIFGTGENYVSWPDALGIAARTTGLGKAHYVPLSTFRPRRGQWVILDQLQIGLLEIRNCPGMAFESLPDDPFAISWIRLGNNIFAHSIVTIDYIKHEMSISPADGDSTDGKTSADPLASQAKKPFSTWMKFQWSSSTDNNSPHAILLNGTVNGRPIKIEPDTGIGFDGLAFVHKELSADLVRQYSLNPSAHLPGGAKITLKKVPWTVGSLHFYSPIVIFPPRPGSEQPDALLGVDVLMYYRTTIDYPRQEILFQWNYPLSPTELSKRLKQGQKVPLMHL